MIHEIHCVADNFAEITAGRKSFILQKETDAQYRVGDFLALNEVVIEPDADDWAAEEITGRCCLVEVVHVYKGAQRYLQPGTIILSIRPSAIATYEGMKFQYNRDIYAVDIYTADRKERA